MRNYGRLAERSKAAVLKTVDVQASGGSNPSPSANATSSGLKRYKKEHAPACSCFCIAYCLALRFAANSGIEMVTLAQSAYERRSLFRRHASPGSLRIPRLPPLVNNTNSENGFVLFFAVDYFGIIVERNYKSQPEQRADWANLRTIQVIILLFFKWIF